MDLMPITVHDFASHRRLNSVQARHGKLTQPVATLQIPNKLFLFWKKQLSLPYCSGCNSVFKRSVLVNSSLPEGTTLASTAALESRLRTLFSNVTKSIQRRKLGARARLENKTTHFAIYQEEVICCSLTTEATDVSRISEETDTIESSYIW